MRRGAVAAGLAALLVVGAAPAAADGARPLLTLGGGIAALFDGARRAAELGIGYRPGVRWGMVRPTLDLLATADGAAYVFGGLAVEVEATPWLVLSAGTAVGAYHQGDGVDLGDWLQFRSGLEAAWRRPDDSRLGLGFYHMSNAGLHRRNPGQESLLLTYTLPLSSALQ